MAVLGVEMSSVEPIIGWEIIQANKKASTDTEFTRTTKNLLDIALSEHRVVTDKIEDTLDDEKRRELIERSNILLLVVDYLENELREVK
jgi:hypothetical protein